MAAAFAARGKPGWGSPSAAAIDARVRDAVEVLNARQAWYPAIDSGGGIRDGAWVVETAGQVDLSQWPAGTRLILHKERPIPVRSCGSPTLPRVHRITGFITDTAAGVVAGQLAELELHHRQHARVEDRIRQAKDTGLPNLPFSSLDANAAWLEIIMGNRSGGLDQA